MGPQLESILSHFLIYSEIWRVKNMICIAGMFFDYFESKMSGFLMSQPLKSIVNTMVFMRSRIFSVFMIWMVSGTTLDNILLSFGGLREPF